jgi:hydrogenase maturation protein HypF
MSRAVRAEQGESVRVRGLVQGVGFRPTVWRIARELGMTGDVRNDGDGVRIRLLGAAVQVEEFCARLLAECPPLARIDALERQPLDEPIDQAGFHIVASAATDVHTDMVPDAATCAACLGEIRDVADRRYRYPFTNCTHCGPRLTIVRGIPYDRANTSMAAFAMCPDCAAEYHDPADRRFHAQPNACPACGPRVWLVDRAGATIDPASLGARDAVEGASRLLAQGRIVAIKGIGGFHLACAAGDAAAVAELRRRKRRHRKPFALMAADRRGLEPYVRINAVEAALLENPAAPIVLLERRTDAPALAPEVAPGQTTLGFMLPYSPLHHLLLSDWASDPKRGPLVMTSGNLSDEPQCVDNGDAGTRLGEIADAFLLHDREIVNRVDDSVLQLMDGVPRLLRRARGYAPSPIRLPAGFERTPRLLALGGELKSTLCLLRDGLAVVSQHLGDLEDSRTADEYLRAIELYQALYRQQPECLVADLHPDYRSTRYGRERAAAQGLTFHQVQHHHAHVCSVLADQGWPADGPAVLGIALDGLGYGPDGTLWGGEFLLAGYHGYDRVGHLLPVAMPGGTRAILEPWRNSYAQIAAWLGWEAFQTRWPGLELTRWLVPRPLEMLAAMMDRGLNSPLSSSCGRLFDAVAGALGVCRERASYEGQAAIELEHLARRAAGAPGGYPFGIRRGEAWCLEPGPMWEALFSDLARGVPVEAIAARFHAGLADAVGGMAADLAARHGVDTIALSGGVFQNRTLFEAVARGLRGRGLRVLAHRQVPSNDGGLSLGQATAAAARLASP